MEACTVPVTVKLAEYMNKSEFAGCNLNPVVVLTDCRKSLKKTTPETPPPSPVGSRESQPGSVSNGKGSRNGFRGSRMIRNDVSGTTTSGPPCRKIRSVKRRRDSSEASVEDEYEIEKIVGCHRDKRGKMWYCIKWKGWSDSYNTYEPIDNLTGCHYKLMRFFEKEEPTRAALVEKDSEVTRGAMKTSFYEKLRTLSCTVKDFEEFLCEFPRKSRQLFRKKQLTPLENKAVDQYAYMVRCLIGMRHRQDPGLIRRAQNYKLFLMLIQQRRRQLKKLAAAEETINNREKTQVRIVNEVDLDEFPDLTYIVDMKPGEGVSVPTEPLLGCECYECNTRSLCCGKMGDSTFAYSSEGKLRTSARVAIYECNSRCLCPATCPNRVVQRGRQVKLCIFKTKSCGWGVRAEESIPKGTFVCEYVGELIPDSEANVRDLGYFKERKSGYVFDLDFYTDSSLEMYCIDATKYGNLARFINHSCDPNLIVYPVWVDCLAPNMHRLAFFARRKIRAGEEIHFDYENMEYHSEDEADDNGKRYVIRMVSNVRCKCNSSNCRKWVFGNK